MSMRRLCFIATLLAGFLCGCCSALAQTSANTSDALEKQLATFDPQAVAAARHYYENPAIKAGMVAMLDNIEKSVFGAISQQNPGLAQKQLTDVEEVVKEAMTERLDLLIDMSMVVALNTFTKDELVAMDRFYSSPEGSSILNKLPKVAAQLPAMMQTIMPDYVNEIRAKMKAKGTDLNL